MIYRFANYRLDTDNLRLVSGEKEVHLEPQVFTLLQFLVENRDRVVSKDEIFANVWGGRLVSDAALNSRINSVRRALGDEGRVQAVVKTFPRRGFRFVADVATGSSLTSPVTSVGWSSDKPSIAVLPFDNLSNDLEQEYFSDGITEDIITALSRLRWLFVIARNSTFGYKGASPEVHEVAKDLGTRYILKGSVRCAGQRARVTSQLIDATTGKHLWAERYDRDLDDIFEVQDDISRRVVGALHPELGKAEQERARAKRPESLDVWDAFQRGMWHTNRRARLDLSQALPFFKKAIDLQPTFAPAYWGWAIASFYIVTFGWAQTRDKVLDEALRNAQQSIHLDPEDPMSHTALGYIHVARRENSLAISALEMAIELDPNNYLAPRMLGIALTSGGNAREGLAHLHMALRLSPRDILASGTLGYIAASHLFLGEWDVAVDWARRAMRGRTAPQLSVVATLLSILGHMGRLDEARNVRGELLRMEPDANCGFVKEASLFTNAAYVDRYVEGLRKAGLRE